ncbi:acetyltransferase, fucose-4-O-acetylase [Rivularia sp. PCC 7116]|uniref:acyltransferase family protein n=1 Tax=Rivularia sp. PCC 7116 TaxID=373994 RepID=UPI00029F3E8D|nr:acyltransferase family protein [Rivularia sp. PCC 7116]AFY55684.1 acetyltransferase, fucose-4-O-acetylase [Rivularia sp. PCC 7116]
MPKRIYWIDGWKGIATALLVLGNVLDLHHAKYIFWFHIPLFLFVSGYMYSEKYDYFSFFKYKFNRLIVPYLSFLTLFSLPAVIVYIQNILVTKQLDSLYELLLFVVKQLYGGKILTDCFSLFWVITCLFFTQQLYNLIYTKIDGDRWLMKIIMLDAYSLAIIDYLFFRDIIFPWNIDAVLMALPFYWLGHMASQNKNIFDSIKLPSAAAIILLAMFLIDKLSPIELIFDMRHKIYGIPIINLVIAASGIVIFLQIAQAIHKHKLFNSIFGEIGTASMAIIYLHQPIQIFVKQVSFLDEVVIRLIAALFIPYLIYKIIINFSVTRKFLLGEFKPLANVKLKKLSKV